MALCGLTKAIFLALAHQKIIVKLAVSHWLVPIARSLAFSFSFVIINIVNSII